MRESTAVVVASVVETTQRPCMQVLPHQQHFLDHEQTFENLYSPHNSDSSSDKINTKLYNKNTKKNLKLN